MAHPQTALRDILTRAGLRRQSAARLEKIIDEDDYLGLTGDDIAVALQAWCRRERQITIESFLRSRDDCPFDGDPPLERHPTFS